MILEASLLLRDEVQRYLRQVGAEGAETEVLLGNVAAVEDNPALQDRVLLTLVNIEEESTLKNGSRFVRNTFQNSVEVLSPAVYLNLYFLFSATLPQAAGDNSYQHALLRISFIIELFQSKKEFTLQNSPGTLPAGADRRRINELRLHPELYTLTFEQINHLWGALGGKQSPSVMYKVRLVKIQRLVTEEAPLIETIQTKAMADVIGAI